MRKKHAPSTMTTAPREDYNDAIYSHGLMRISNLGGGRCKPSVRKVKKIWRTVRKGARISYCSFRKVAPMKRISAQLRGLQPPMPPPLLCLCIQLTLDIANHRYSEHLDVTKRRPYSNNVLQILSIL